MVGTFEKTWDWNAIRIRCLKEATVLTGSRADAEDVVQEALARAWRMRHKCRNERTPTPWVLQITRNEALRERGRPREQPFDPHQETWPERSQSPSGTDAILERMALDGALKTLKEDERAAVMLRYTDDLTQPDVAIALGIPEGTVKVRLHRARMKLRSAGLER